MSKTTTELCYPVLTPFKFHGVVVKPPAVVQMSADEAQLYQVAGVLGGEDVAALPPEPETDGDATEHDEIVAEGQTPMPKKPAAKATKAAAKKASK